MLYYPLVVPPTEILHQALLYWDGIATLVPRAPEVYDAAVPAWLRQLEERHLYSPLIFDADAVERLPPAGWNDYSGASASQALSEQLQIYMATRNPYQAPAPRDAFLYGSKLSYWLEHELVSRGLADRCDTGFWSLAVPREVQQMVIGAVVRDLAADSRVSYVPYTDHRNAYACAMHPAFEDRAPAWTLELGRLLPVPSPGTPTAEVLAFRDRHGDERERLMRALHRLLGDLRRDYHHPTDVMHQLRREIDQAVADYRGAAKASRMAWVARSVTVTIALTAAAGTVVHPPAAWLLGAVGGYALNVATREIRPLAKARDEHDFSYLHTIHKEMT